MKPFARAVACAAAVMFAPDATAQRRADGQPVGASLVGGPRAPEPNPDNTYIHTTQAPGADSRMQAGLAAVGAVLGAFALGYFVRDTRRVFAPRRRHPWEG